MQVNKRLATILLTLVLGVVSDGVADDAPQTDDDAKSFVWPDTPAGTVLNAFFDAFNDGSLEAMTTFERTYGDEPDEAEAAAARIHAIIAQVGTLTAVELHDSAPTRCAVIAEASKIPMKLMCQLDLESADEPWRVASIALRPASNAPRAADPQWDRDDWTSLDELLSRAAASTGTPAIAMVVMQDGKIVEQAVVGQRSVDDDMAVTMSDRFHVGSITKSMTATVVGSVVESGKLSWSDTLGELLPDVEMQDVYRDVTIEELLQHRSGVPAMTTLTDEDAAPLDALAGTSTEVRGQFIRQLLMDDPAGTPHGASSYSNAGYGLAGYLAEQATGKSWEALLQEVIFDPLGMSSAGCGWPASPDRPDQPRGHQFVNDTYQTIPFGDYDLGPYIDPAGDVHCSATDLAKYGQAHLAGLHDRSGGLLTAATIKRLHTSLHPELDGMPYAGGWVIRSTEDGVIHWHNGSAGTFFAQLELEPERDRVCVVMMNIGAAGQEITDRLLAAVRTRLNAGPATDG